MQLAAQEREFCQWERTAVIVAQIYNSNRDSKAKPLQAWDFWHRPGQRRPRSGQALTPDALRALGPVIGGGRS